jgi:hypothetical protein
VATSSADLGYELICGLCGAVGADSAVLWVRALRTWPRGFARRLRSYLHLKGLTCTLRVLPAPYGSRLRPSPSRKVQVRPLRCR